MICIKNEIIQKYIDGETSPEELTLIENHLKSCSSCAQKIEHQKKLAIGIKNVLNELSDEIIKIPKFSAPKPKTKGNIKRRIIYTLSAACILFFVLIITKKKAPETRKEVTIIQSFEWEVDANQPVTNQQLSINVIDGDGNLTEYFID